MEYARKKYLAVRVARAGGVELVTRAGDGEDQLTLMLAPPAHGIENGIAECCEKKSVLVFSVLGILAGAFLCVTRDEAERACDVTDRREWLL